jgi:hypothetical protein
MAGRETSDRFEYVKVTILKYTAHKNWHKGDALHKKYIRTEDSKPEIENIVYSELLSYFLILFTRFMRVCLQDLQNVLI